jgi:RES domain-containing protein
MTLDRTGITAPRITHAGIAYRNQSPRYDPRSGEGARINGGRFNPPGFPTLYLCETRPCVVAELTRQGTRHVVGVEGLLPRVLYRYELCPIPLRLLSVLLLVALVDAERQRDSSAVRIRRPVVSTCPGRRQQGVTGPSPVHRDARPVGDAAPGRELRPGKCQVGEPEDLAVAVQPAVAMLVDDRADLVRILGVGVVEEPPLATGAPA